MSKQLWSLLNSRSKIAANLLKHNENKTPPLSLCIRYYAQSNSSAEDDLLNKPLKYTTSPANDWKAANSRIGSKAEFGPWYEPHIVAASMISFMIYFFILREESDIDLMLERPLTDTLKKE